MLNKNLCILPLVKEFSMVVGDGMVAKRFIDYANHDSILIFASGVSNSKSIIQDEYDREFLLLKQSIENNAEKIIIYFSTCSIYDAVEQSSHYVLHKIMLEKYIQINCKKYIILRASNLVGVSPNPNTILNFITKHIKSGVHFNLWVNATRNLIDLDDFFLISKYAISNEQYLNKVLNIANPDNYPMSEIVSIIEKYYHKTANYTVVEKGDNFIIDIVAIKPIIDLLKVNFGENYLENLLLKYY
jgi:nucleoside-diphosphate-sugar epimerase